MSNVNTNKHMHHQNQDDMTFQKGKEPSPNDNSENNISDNKSDKSSVSNISRLAKRNEL